MSHAFIKCLYQKAHTIQQQYIRSHFIVTCNIVNSIYPIHPLFNHYPFNVQYTYYPIHSNHACLSNIPYSYPLLLFHAYSHIHISCPLNDIPHIHTNTRSHTYPSYFNHTKLHYAIVHISTHMPISLSHIQYLPLLFCIYM